MTTYYRIKEGYNIKLSKDEVWAYNKNELEGFVVHDRKESLLGFCNVGTQERPVLLNSHLLFEFEKVTIEKLKQPATPKENKGSKDILNHKSYNELIKCFEAQWLQAVSLAPRWKLTQHLAKKYDLFMAYAKIMLQDDLIGDDLYTTLSSEKFKQDFINKRL